MAARAEDRHSALKMLDEPWIAGVRDQLGVALAPDGRFVAGIEHGRWQRAFPIDVDGNKVKTLVDQSLTGATCSARCRVRVN